ncbi:MAG: SCP2 sterol-binding domain-containing protein [Bacillota bacterium]
MATTREIIAEMEKRLAANPAKLQGINAVYQFTLTGDDGGNWQVKVEGGQATFSEGTPDKANCTITMSSADFKEMVGGKLNATAAFMSGRLRIAGDMALAMKLQAIVS